MNRLAATRERSYRSDIISVKNSFLDEASERYKRTGSAISEQAEDELMNESRKISRKSSDKTIEAILLVTFALYGDELNQGQIKATQARYFADVGTRMGRETANTTTADVRRIIERGMRAGMTNEEIAEEIIKLKKYSRWRANTIARTEVGFAEHVAQREGFEKLARTSEEKLYKKWITSRDSRVRTIPPAGFDHVVMEGVVIPEDQLFDVQGDQIYAPRDPGGQPGNVINCRCNTVLYKESELNL